MNKSEVTKRRKALGLSKAALAREAGLNASTICSIESGNLKPYPGQVEKLRAAFERLEAEKGA